ncbi:MAG: OmpH family outer membrane protein [Ignavibacteriales bacterium]|nr:MAG: OmpH family outer membrane protein [Ignavibacteriales bacterium]
MKKFLFIIITILITTLAGFAQTPQKIGYVDSQVILTQLPEAIKAQGDLDALTNMWSAQVDSMTLLYQQSLADYQKQANTMTEEKKVAAQQSLIKMEQDILEFRRQKFGQGTGEIYQKQEQIFTPVKNKIYAAIQQVAKDEGMQFVFDKSGDIILLYADAAFDVTYKVLDKLKRGN